jgi:hypothetical protein
MSRMPRSSLEPVVPHAEIALRDRQVVGGQRGGPNGMAPGWTEPSRRLTTGQGVRIFPL